MEDHCVGLRSLYLLIPCTPCSIVVQDCKGVDRAKNLHIGFANKRRLNVIE